MAVNTKAITGRINSVKSTKKITKAMEMISAVKMRRATENVLKSRGYAELGWEMLQDIAKKTDINLHPLLKTTAKADTPVGIILITGNRGLAGGFTSRLLNKINQDFAHLIDAPGGVEIILLGKKGRKIHSQFGFKLGAEFEKIDLTTKMEEVNDLSQMVITEFINKKYREVYLAYMDFASAMNQVPRTRQLLPLLREPDTELGQTEKTSAETTGDKGIEFKFEPDPKEVLDMLLPRLVETQIYQAILESDASEHSARMMSMKNASEAAGDMIDELNHTFNRARQAAITQEISEIVSGAAMLG